MSLKDVPVQDILHRKYKMRLAAWEIQGDQKVSMHLMITIQKFTSNIKSVPRESPDIY
jgi:hypothetical protein